MSLSFAYSYHPVNGEMDFSQGAPAQDAKTWLHLIDDAARKEWHDAVDAVAAGGEPRLLQHRLKLPSGSIPVEHRIAAIPKAGRWPMITGHISPVLIDTSRLETIEHMTLTANLAAGIVHDFKNILAGVQNIVEWCQSESRYQPQVATALGRTVIYLDQASQMMTSLLRIARRREDENPEAIHLDQQVRELEMLVRHLIPANIEVKLKTCSCPPVLARRNDLQEIFLNLCLNARNAMHKEGDLLLIEVEPRTADGQTWAVLVIEDRGCGMSPEQEKRAFEAFFTTSPTGTGLGLWMVNHRARSMGGHVTLNTKLGQGTRFEIHLPVCATLDAPRARLSEISSGNQHFSRSHLILFVEDEPLIQQGVQRWLESLGLEVIACSNGHEAVAAFRQNADRIELILQDYMLPGISGGELLKIFKKERPEIPVVVMSAFASGVEESGLLQKGAVAFLPKPFRMADLVEMVHKQLENR